MTNEEKLYQIFPDGICPFSKVWLSEEYREPTTKNNLGVDREEAIETLKENLCAMCAYGSQNMESCDIRSCDNRNAIKALEQEPILDKLRVEIEQNAYPIVHGINNHELGMTLYGILQVIDKYKAESEVT